MKIILDLVSIFTLVQLDDDDLVPNTLLLQELLGLGAVGAVSLGEDNDTIVGYKGQVQWVSAIEQGKRHQQDLTRTRHASYR